MSTVECPICRESIQPAALKCRFCGQVLVPKVWREEYAEWQRDPAAYASTRLPDFSEEQRAFFDAALQVLQEEERSRPTPPKVIASAEIEYLAQNWGSFSDRHRADWWTRLSPEERSLLRSTIDSAAPKPVQVGTSTPLMPAPGVKKKTSPLAWGCLICLGFVGLVALVPDSKPSKRSATPPQTPALRLSANDSGRAQDSVYERDITLATTSYNLSNSDIAWHALNTYGWDCNQVVSRTESAGGFFMVVCSNGTLLRVYPRSGQHPRITNAHGGYD